MSVTIDIESQSYADLKKVGAWAYSQHPTTKIIVISWGIDDLPIQSWWPGKKGMKMVHGMPHDLYMAIVLGHEIEAHNIAFEYSMFHNLIGPKHGWLIPHDHQWRDTMATACYYALPAGLDRLARALGFKSKNPEGTRLITKYCKLHLKSARAHIPHNEWVPKAKMTQKEKDENPDWKTDGGFICDDFGLFVAYCEQDVRIEQSVSDFLGDLPPHEQEIFTSDLELNARGLYLDVEGIEAATEIVRQRAERLTKEFRALTGLNPTQGEKIKRWFSERGVWLDNLQAEYINDLMESDAIPSGDERRALRIRVQINKASTKKLDAMTRQVGDDDRAHFQTRYHGAVTGRGTGTGLQPLNLNRGFDGMDPNQLMCDIMRGDAEWLDMLYGDATDAIAKASRYFIMAELGNKIIAGDFVSVEAVILACLAGEQWKIDAFTRGVKIYEYMADKIYDLEPGTVTKATHPAERQDGKTGELAFGFQGALGAWLKFDSSGRHSDKRILEICKAWRDEHPYIVAFWAGLEEAAIEAVLHPGKVVFYRQIGFEIVDEWLTMILPDGKRCWYWKPQMRLMWPQWHKPTTDPDCQEGTCDCNKRWQLTYMANKGGQWHRVSTYGGKLSENATQATSRQILEPARKRLVEVGYIPILKVYDEIVCEVPIDFGSKDEMERIMDQCPGDWAAGWPIRSDAWEGDRYKK